MSKWPAFGTGLASWWRKMSMSASGDQRVDHSREFENPFPDYNGERLVDTDGQLLEPTIQKLRSTIDKLLKVMYTGMESGIDQADHSIYTGVTGYSLLHLHLHLVLDKGDKNSEYLRRATPYVDRPLRHLKRKRLTFMCGDAGPLALGAIIYTRLDQQDKVQDCLKRLISRHKDVVEDPSLPDELLYGVVGYLSSLLLLQKHLGPDFVNPAILDKVYDRVISSGQQTSQLRSSDCPLMYEWHGKAYLGAAHGLAGILYMLMHFEGSKYQSNLDTLIKPTVDYMMALRLPSGNCPSSLGNNTDRLVHWCHGAPGWIYMFIKAHQVFGNPEYLEAALGCGEVIWERGLLKKGYGICHGTAGNAYAHLALYRVTRDQKHLHRALKFAEWCYDYGKHGCRTPDRPYSMFEGLAGTIYFLTDLLNLDEARFPAFEL